MKTKIIGITAAFLILITAFFAVFFFMPESRNPGEKAVIVNEIERLTQQLKDNPDDKKTILLIKEATEEFEQVYSGDNTKKVLIPAYIACIIFAAAVFLTCYVRIIRPFSKLEKFAKEVAAGNLDFPLKIERENVFGEFSWAFDFMRTELKSAKESEELARAENKALIAAISHDIKTPVASIRAYAEALSNNMDSGNSERRERYLSVIMKKSDEVAKLTNDLFLHALSDMEKLKMELKPHNSKALINEILDPFFAEYGDKIKIKTDIPEANIIADEKRLAQVFDNVITNAVKYAPESDIELSFEVDGGELVCEIRDFGNGIPPKDMPFIFNRFYRGENSRDIQGTGLGLYIVKHIAEKCGGKVRINNSENGLCVSFSMALRKF